MPTTSSVPVLGRSGRHQLEGLHEEGSLKVEGAADLWPVLEYRTMFLLVVQNTTGAAVKEPAAKVRWRAQAVAANQLT